MLQSRENRVDHEVFIQGILDGTANRAKIDNFFEKYFLKETYDSGILGYTENDLWVILKIWNVGRTCWSFYVVFSINFNIFVSFGPRFLIDQS